MFSSLFNRLKQVSLESLSPVFITLVVLTLYSCGQSNSMDAGIPSPYSTPVFIDGENQRIIQTPVTGDWLIQRLQDEPDTLNFITSSDYYANRVQEFLFETLITRDPRTMEWIPVLAESWEESDDRLIYTFHLRKDIKWHNGQPFTADDIVFSFETLRDPKVTRAARLRNYYQDVEDLEKLDDYTVRFTLSQVYSLAFEKLGAFPIVPKSVYDDEQDFETHPAGRTPIGTGPYKFVEWKTNQEIILDRNPDWWGYAAEKPAYVDRIIFRIVPDAVSAFQQLQAGQLDMMSRFEQIQWVKQMADKSITDKFNKFEFYVPSYSYIAWNSLKPFFSDKKVRRAMTHLVDREKFIDKILYGLGHIVTGNLFFQSPYSDSSIKPWPYNPTEAVRLLDEAGWSDHDGDGIRDKDGVKFEFTFLIPADSKKGEQISTLLQEELLKVGIRMSIKRLEWATFLEDIQTKKFDATTLSWSMPWSVDFYQIWHSSSAGPQGSNYVSFKNKEADTIIEKLRQSFDEQERIQLCHRFHQIMHEEQPYTFMYCASELLAVDKRFQDVETFRIRPGFDCTEWWVPQALQRYP